MIDIFSVTFLLGIVFGLFAGFTIKSYFSKKNESEFDVNDYTKNLKDLLGRTKFSVMSMGDFTLKGLEDNWELFKVENNE